MSPTMKNLMNKSPAFKAATAAMNSVVDQANAAGKKLSVQELDALREIRIFATILGDPAVYKEFAGEVWEAARKKEA